MHVHHPTPRPTHANTTLRLRKHCLPQNRSLAGKVGDRCFTCGYLGGFLPGCMRGAVPPAAFSGTDTEAHGPLCRARVAPIACVVKFVRAPVTRLCHGRYPRLSVALARGSCCPGKFGDTEERAAHHSSRLRPPPPPPLQHSVSLTSALRGSWYSDAIDRVVCVLTLRVASRDAEESSPRRCGHSLRVFASPFLTWVLRHGGQVLAVEGGAGVAS